MNRAFTGPFQLKDATLLRQEGVTCTHGRSPVCPASGKKRPVVRVSYASKEDSAHKKEKNVVHFADFRCGAGNFFRPIKSATEYSVSSLGKRSYDDACTFRTPEQTGIFEGNSTSKSNAVFVEANLWNQGGSPKNTFLPSTRSLFSTPTAEDTEMATIMIENKRNNSYNEYDGFLSRTSLSGATGCSNNLHRHMMDDGLDNEIALILGCGTARLHPRHSACYY